MTANPSKSAQDCPPMERNDWACWECRSACCWWAAGWTSNRLPARGRLSARKSPSKTCIEGRDTKTKIKVLLADDHKVVRQGLRAVLEAEADLEAVGEADDG